MIPWNKGLTKATHPSVAKTSATMRARKVDNFAAWRRDHVIAYPSFPRNGMLAEFIGVVLGDGHIQQFPRTERLIIVGDARKMDFINRYAAITKVLFRKTPMIGKVAASNAVRISIYQKFISERLGIPSGNRKNFPYRMPEWIRARRAYTIRFLRGLYEAEGYLCVHLPTCTHNFGFSNFNQHLLGIVARALRELEFHPEIRHNAIRVRRKSEVERLRKLLHFREY